ncbi:hypothetical protein AN958_04057 [Leucoagaricus sp. SymC.cos]|nr:hypothetical protein AN958_04057 [Leucoagaricus sp. SymC.cos]
MDSQPPPADEPDTLASVQLLLSQIDSESRALEVVSKANNLSREDIQLLVDALSTSLDKNNALTRSQSHICLTLVKIASATNVVSRNRTIKSESMTSTGDDDIFTITGQTPCQVKVVRRSQDDSSTVSNRPEGTVYAAQHTQNHNEDFIRWAHLAHPNILSVYATFSNDNNLVFVSPCLPEASVCDHAQRLPKELRLRLILDVASGLSYLHQLNIIHGGLTPEAVLISSEGHALIAALDATSEAEGSDSLPTRYSAPEILKDENIRPTKAVDVWSFAFKVVRRSQDDSSTVSNRPEGTVYAAQHTQNHSEELIRWAHLTHPNILPVYATFSNDNNLIFVSPCLPEANACDHAQRLPKEQRLPLILDVASGLSYLHQLNIIHGGLTPEAVLISSEGHALIAALDATSEAEGSDSLPTRYSAPEILKDENIRPTKAVDVWSFACDRPVPKLAIGPDALGGCTTDIGHVKTVVTRLLGSISKQIPEHLRNSLYKLVNDRDKHSATAAAAKKLRPGQVQVLHLILYFLKVISDSIHVPTAMLLSEITASTHTVPSSCMVKGVQFDSTMPIMEGLDTKAYKGRELNIRVDVVMDFGAATIFDEAPRICLITPLLENGTMRDYAPTLPQKSRLPLIADVINGLAYIHSTWDIHIGGLHGQRVLISNDGRAMIATFGTQLLFYEEENVKVVYSYSRRFQPPSSRYRPGAKADIRSLGCFCYEVLTRKTPYYQYPDDHEVVTTNSCAELPRRPARSDNDIDEIDDKAWDLITKCCAQNTDNQPSLSQIQEMVADLGIEDNRPAAKPLVGPEVLALRSRPDIDLIKPRVLWERFRQVELLRNPLLKLTKNRTKDITEMVAELESSDIYPVIDFLDQALKNHISIPEERNSVLAILSKITSVTHIFPQRYELKGIKYCPKPIAEGGFSNVHQGVDPSMCVKVMKRLDPGALTPWIKELILWAHSSHPNVLPFYGVFVEGTRDSPQTCLVSPFMKNGNLHDYAPRLFQKFRLPLISDIVHGLHYLHELGIVHGDLKGQNVLISDEGHCLITDFHASHITTATTASGSLSATTLRFSAPEMILGNKKPSKKFDIWSVGCLFYEVLSQAPSLISDVVHGLHYLLGLDIVHGDLKGQNVLISDEGYGLITDFGASHTTRATAASGALSATTLRFSAPEMILGNKKPSKEFDTWSVGCLFYEVLSHKEPYYEYEYEVQIIAALSRKEPPTRPGTTTDSVEKDDWDDDFDQDWDTIDDQAWSLIMECCTPEPEN